VGHCFRKRESTTKTRKKWNSENDNKSDDDGRVCSRILGIHNTLAQHDYDAKTVETIGGTVLSIEKTTPEKKRGYWIDLMLQTEKETIAVQLGPAWYIDKQTPRIEANDTITVTGSRVTMDGRSAIVAADITKGNELLKLREDNGITVWPRSH
jgi:hypothetical protein